METFTHTSAEGVDHRFAHLTVYDIYGDPKKPVDPKDPKPNGIVPGYRKRLKLQLLETLNMAGFTPDQVVIELVGFDKQPVSFDTFLEFLDTPTGRTETVGYAWDLANPGVPQPKLSAADWQAVRAKLFDALGIEFSEPAAAAEGAKPSTATYGDGADSPNPQPPLTYTETAPTTVTEPGTVGGGSATTSEPAA